MELILGNLLQWQELVHTGVVHQYVQRVECLFDFGKQALHVASLGNIALYGDDLTAACFNLNISDDAVRGLVAESIVHDHCGTRPRSSSWQYLRR
jgi:hypothetical protein